MALALRRNSDVYVEQKNPGTDGATYDMMIHPSGDDVIAGEDDATPRVFSDGRTVSNLHHGAGDRTQLGTSCLADPERRASDVGGGSRGRTRRRLVRNVGSSVTRDPKFCVKLTLRKCQAFRDAWNVVTSASRPTEGL